MVELCQARRPAGRSHVHELPGPVLVPAAKAERPAPLTTSGDPALSTACSAVPGLRSRPQPANNENANALVDTLKSKGVEARDIQTSQLSIDPTYDDKGRRITGYSVHNLVTATLHDIAGAGALIDAAAGAVGDAVRVQSIGFSIDDDSALKAEARTRAVHLAQLQAEQMAKAAGVKLGAIRLISEVPTGAPMPYAQDAYRAVGGAPAASAPAPILPGEQELSLTVDVVWDIAR